MALVLQLGLGYNQSKTSMLDGHSKRCCTYLGQIKGMRLFEVYRCKSIGYFVDYLDLNGDRYWQFDKTLLLDMLSYEHFSAILDQMFYNTLWDMIDS